MKSEYTIAFLGIILLFSACKKNTESSDIPATGSRAELSLDSLYLYASETYLWYNSLPSYQRFQPRQFNQSTNQLTNMRQALKSIAAYSYETAGEPPKEFRQGIETPLYSFISANNIMITEGAATGLQKSNNGFGIELILVNQQSVYISSVDPGSPAAIAGLRKGMKLVSVNEQPVTGNHDLLNKMLQQKSVRFGLINPDKSRITTVLNAQNYRSVPVLATKTWVIGQKRIGYMALSSFNKLEFSRNYIDSLFDVFSTGNISDLIIDVRYNAGGYIQTMEYIANQMVPASLTGAIMYSEYFNQLLQNRKAPILKTIPYLNENGEAVYINGRPASFADIDFSVNGNTATFKSAGKINNLQTIVFLVNGRTASASELLINSLLPYFNVKLVGQTTYGKPVGFFGIGIDHYTVYLTQFHIRNANGEGGYFEGMQVDIPADEDPEKEFGDETEEATAKAIHYITTGQYPLSNQKKNAQKIESLYSNRFMGMIKEP